MKVLNCLCAGLTLVAASSVFAPELRAQLTGLHVEPVTTHDGTVGSSDLTGHTTYRVYATLTSPADLIQAVYGSAEAPLNVSTTTDFWQTPATSVEFGTSVNPAFFSAFPELAYDSWFTIGLESIPSQGPAGSEQIGSIGMDTELGMFEAGANFLLNSDVGGSYYALPGATNGIAGDDLEVLLGQFTTSGLLSGTLNLQIFLEGNTVDVQQVTMSFEAGLPGCTNPEACNYDAAAELDNGSCVVPVEGVDCEGNCLADADGDGVCDGDEVPGCTDATACNFNAAATNDAPETCTYALSGYNCEGNCLADADGDGVCDPFEIAGCTDASAPNYDAAATDDDGSCTADGESFCGFGTVWDEASGTCVWDGQTGAAPSCQADFTEDGLISISDLLEWLPFYGETCE